MPYVDPKAFLTSVLHNGMGRYVCQLQRLTLRFCKEFPASRGMRDFIEKDLLDFARQNPGIVVYVQPRRHQAAELHAEYLNGRVEDLRCSGLKRELIIKYIDQFRCRSGVEIMTLRKDMRTETPSIQGPWNPFINQPTSWNVTQFPESEGLKALRVAKSATENVLEMARVQGILNVVECADDKRMLSEPEASRHSLARDDDQAAHPVTAGRAKSPAQ